MNVFAAVGRVFLTFLAETGRLAIFAGDAVTGFIRPPVYWSLIGKQMMRIGYYSLPVVGLTAFFTGGVLALQIYNGASRYGAESFVPVGRAGRHHARAGPGDRGADGGGPRGGGHRGRDRHHARDRADRRAHHARDQPDQVPRRAAPHRGGGVDADPGRHRRLHRRVRRLYRFDAGAGLQRRGLSQQHDQRRHL